MKLGDSFSNIDKFGMVIKLSPRPHTITVARFSLKSCSIISILEFKIMFTSLGMGMILDQHEKERTLIKAKSKGEEDPVPCIVIATNTGKWKLDGEHNTEVRFKPLGINRAKVMSPYLNDPYKLYVTSSSPSATGLVLRSRLDTTVNGRTY
jgi:hypothetical protein